MKVIDWVIVGGGLSGIISICVIYNRFPSNTILWIDKDNFNGGDLSLYPEVYANTPIKTMIKFFSELYDMINITKERSIIDVSEPDSWCTLGVYHKDLLKLSSLLLKLNNVSFINDNVNEIKRIDNLWKLQCINGNESEDYNEYVCDKIVLATGCNQKTLIYDTPAIPIYNALNIHKLIELDNNKNITNKKIVVFGNSHSGILILKNLVDMKCKNISCVYKRHICIPYYNKNTNTIEINEQTGLRGIALEWVNKNIYPTNKTNIQFIKYDNDNLQTIINEADYLIYAIGLEQRQIPIINTCPNEQDKTKICYKNIAYNPHTGLICENIYGIGVAFPDYYFRGTYQCKIGMYEFLEQTRKILLPTKNT